MLPLVAVAIYADAIGEIAGWMAATSTAMATAARHGHLPARFAAENRRNTARPVLIGQAIIGSLISLLFIFEPSVSSLFWLLSSLLVQLYLLMYVLMFAAALRFRHTRPGLSRPFRIPGGIVGVWAVCGTGMLFSIAAVVVGFVPPTGLPEATAVSHTLTLIVAVVLSVAAPLVISRLSRQSGKPAGDAATNSA